MPDTEKLSKREKLSYGFGDFASCLYWTTISSYLSFFYTDIFGISARSAAHLITYSRFGDAIVDPVIGMAADRTHTRWGKYRPYLLWFFLPLSILGVLCFTVPDFSVGGKLFWGYVTFNALMLVYTAINIPYTAMLGVLSSDAHERTALSSIKFVGAFAAGIVVNWSLLRMAKAGGWLGASSDKVGWQLAFVVFGGISAISFLIVFFNTRERVSPPKAQKTSVWRDLRDLTTNGPWLILLATTLTFILFVAVRLPAITFYFKYVVGPQTVTLPSLWIIPASVAGTHVRSWETLTAWFNTSNQALSLIGVMLVPFFSRLTGRKTAFVVLLAIAVASTAAFYVLSPEQLVLIFVINAIGSITGGPLSALLWAMYADTADFGEWKTGRRATGLVFSASIFSQKVGWAVGSGMGLKIMDLFGYKANEVQTLSSKHALVDLMSVVPSVFGILALVIVLFFPLRESKMLEIAGELRKRRGTEAPFPTQPIA